VADNEEQSPSIPWLPLITLIGVGSGVLLFFPQLTSSRPGGGNLQLAGNTFDKQTINARLWQDPLGVASADQEKNEKQSEEKSQNYRELHSVAHFQQILISKCFAQSANVPLKNELRFVEQASHVQILAVTIPGGPYVEDVERRLRSRRAVIEGLGTAGYDPEEDHEIGYFYVPWQPLESNVAACVHTLEENRVEDESRWFPIRPGLQPARQHWKGLDANKLLVPYEWYEPADFRAKKKLVQHVLVLWLTDDAFRDAPLARLADLISWFRLKLLFSANVNVAILSPPVPVPIFTVLGPDNSGTLHNMVIEAKGDRWNNDTRQCLATTHFYSSQAAAAESRLLFGLTTEGEPHIPTKREPATCKNLIEQNVKRLQSDNRFCFDRTIPPDNRIVETLLQELERRGVTNNDDVAIISEKDTYYARALCSTFKDLNANATSPLNVHSYIYLRGIDGKLPSDEKDEKEAKGAAESGAKNTQSSLRPTERTEGLNQADDLRRLAVMLQSLDTGLRNTRGRGLKAVGLLGSDVYDKLELLKALRPVLPEAVFFTNNLDACLAHPDEWNETHNLLVVSARGLSLENDKNPALPKDYQKVPPFRDSGQTALFEATLDAMGRHPATPSSPLIFEISRNDPKQLGIADDSKELARSFKRYLWHLVYFIAFGSLLVAWVWLVSRVSFVPSDRALKLAGEEFGVKVPIAGPNSRHPRTSRAVKQTTARNRPA
jgi:hypothetical protein